VKLNTKIKQGTLRCNLVECLAHFLPYSFTSTVTPDLEKVKQIDGLLLHVTAQGKNVDCVSRSFAPKLAIAEDPVCGSGHCHIIPYWAKTLKKDRLVAYQASSRGGTLYCRMEGSKVFMAGKAALYSIDELYL